MTDTKIYLNVPYAEKDAAKALGARWDAANKKWYVPGGKDVAAFSKWQPGAGGDANSPPAAVNQTKPRTAPSLKTADDEIGAVTTFAASKDFVAYNGVEPPWD